MRHAPTRSMRRRGFTSVSCQLLRLRSRPQVRLHLLAAREFAFRLLIRYRAGDGMATYLLRLFPGKPGHTPCVIPVGNIDIGLLVDIASVRGAKERGRDITRLKLVVGPLLLLRVIAKKGHRSVIAVENRDTAFEFRDDGAVAMKACLARSPQMLRDGADKLAVKIEVAQAAVLAIAHQHQRLVIASVY